MNWNLLRQLGFRRPMSVTEVVYLHRCHASFPRCPRCHLTMEREYMNFCDRCGQRLDWTTFDESAEVLFK